jgi:hypothetical protein
LATGLSLSLRCVTGNRQQKFTDCTFLPPSSRCSVTNGKTRPRRVSDKKEPTRKVMLTRRFSLRRACARRALPDE